MRYEDVPRCIGCGSFLTDALCDECWSKEANSPVAKLTAEIERLKAELEAMIAWAMDRGTIEDQWGDSIAPTREQVITLAYLAAGLDPAKERE
jgi:hypothetical protein